MNSIALTFIKTHEGVRLEAYQDQKGVWTIGVGHTGPEVHAGLVWTQAQVDAALAADMAVADDAVGKLVKPKLSEMSKAALISFVFNLGSGSLTISDALKSINTGDYLAGARQLASWDHIGKTEDKGLLIRRLEEAVLFLRGL